MAYFQTSDTGVTVNLKAANGRSLHCSGTVAASTLDTTLEYEKGCMYIKTDVVTGTKAMYENVGTATTPSWNLLGETVAGDITLAEGNILVGNSSGVGVALDIGATDTGIAIGNGTTATIAVLSGDATMTNAGVVTVDAATAAFAVGTSATVGTTLGVTGLSTLTGGATIGGALIQGGTGAITSTSGAGAVAVTGQIHEVTTTGTGDALTLANGTAGQRLTVIYVAEGAGGDTAVITPTTLAGGSTITLNALGDSADIQYSATGGWYVLGLGGSAAVA